MTTVIAGVINQAISKKKEVKGWIKQIIAWVIGSGLSVAAWGFKFIEFGSPVWAGVIALCVIVGLASNGIYDIEIIKQFINSWFSKKEE